MEEEEEGHAIFFCESSIRISRQSVKGKKNIVMPRQEGSLQTGFKHFPPALGLPFSRPPARQPASHGAL